MKKIICLIALFFMFVINSAFAVYSPYEVEESIAKLEQLEQDDFFSMIKK